MARKLAEGSIFTTDDQVSFYREQMGEEKTAKQVRAAKLENRQCICSPHGVKKRWLDSTKATTRKVHDVTCPKWKVWMGVEVLDG